MQNIKRNIILSIFLTAIILSMFLINCTCILTVTTNNNSSTWVNPTGPSPKAGQYYTWTLMVYMVGDNNLEEAAIEDFNEMESGLEYVIRNGNPNIMTNMAVIVLFDRAIDDGSGYSSVATEDGLSDWTGSRLYRVLPDTNSSYFNSQWLDYNTTVEKNMGNPETLKEFLGYCITNFTATNYGLILWNHGGGARASGSRNTSIKLAKDACFDDFSYDGLYLDEIQQGVSSVFSVSKKLEFIGFDACLMGTIEVAYEFRDLSKYFVASMHTEQGDGWDYDYIFSNITNSRDESLMTGADFTKLVVEGYQDYITTVYHSIYGTESGETMSAIDLGYIVSLRSNINLLAQQIDLENDLNPKVKTNIQNLRDASTHFWDATYPEDSITYPYIDLGDFVSNIMATTDPSITDDLKSKATNVSTNLGKAVLLAFGDSGNSLNPQSSYYGKGEDVNRGLSIFFSRGEQDYNGLSEYAYQCWYSYADVQTWTNTTTLDTNWNDGGYYGKIDFCFCPSSISNDGQVDVWRDLFEDWYDRSSDGVTNYDQTPGDRLF